MEDFGRAILLSFDLTAEPALRAAANGSLDQLRRSEEGWLFCLQAFSTAREEQVKFWCLQTLVDMVKRERRYEALPITRKQALQSALLLWLQSKGVLQTDEPASVKNKFAQLLIAVIRCDFPRQWPTVFSSILSMLQNGPTMVDLFLRILNTLNDEVCRAWYPDCQPRRSWLCVVLCSLQLARWHRHVLSRPLCAGILDYAV